MRSRSRLSRLPRWLSHCLGYREYVQKQPGYIVHIWSFVGAFCAVSLLQAVFGHAQYFVERQVPPVIASSGASAVLIFGSSESPFAQPRSLVGGHFIGALVGVCTTKLFGLLHDPDRIESLRWVAASLATSITVVAMQLTRTIHPPAGATVLLAVVYPPIYDLSWYYIPVILLSSALVLTVALIINNIQLRYPVFWINPDFPRETKLAEASPTEQMEKKNESREISLPELRFGFSPWCQGDIEAILGEHCQKHGTGPRPSSPTQTDHRSDLTLQDHAINLSPLERLETEVRSERTLRSSASERTLCV